MNRFHSALKGSIGLILALACAGPPLLAAEVLGFEPSYWDQSMTGTMRADGDLLQGTEFDLQDTLGLEENDKLPAGVLWLRWLKRNSLLFSMAASRRNGDQVLSSPLVFDDQTFPAGEALSSRVETDLKSLLYGYDFLNLRLFRMGLRVGADRFSLDTDLESGATPLRASVSESVTFPVVGLGLGFEPMPWLRFVGEINGIGSGLSGKDVTFYDARVQAEIYWARFFGITIGYRRVKIEADLEDFGAADLNQKGPYAGFVLRF